MIGSMNVGDHVAALVDAARAAGRTDDPMLRQDLADVYIRGTVLRYLGDRVLTAVRTGGQVGPEASTIKLGVSRFMGRLGDVATRVLDADGLLEGGAAGVDRQRPATAGCRTCSWGSGRPASAAAPSRSNAT